MSAWTSASPSTRAEPALRSTAALVTPGTPSSAFLTDAWQCAQVMPSMMSLFIFAS